jgi:hypothetical protein
MNGKTSLVALLVFGAMTAAARAEDAKEPEEPSFKVSPTIFADFTYTDAPVAKGADGSDFHPSAFNVSRAYVNLTGRIAKNITYRITPDVRPDLNDATTDKSLSGSNVFRLKYAFAQVAVDGIGKGSWVRFGLQQTPLIDYQESIYRYRFQGNVFAEREGYLTSSDYALSGHAVFPKDHGDVHVGVYNGDGFGRFDPNGQKAFQARASFRPFPGNAVIKGLRLAGFVDLDRYATSADRERYVAALTFEHPRLRAGVEHLWATDEATSASPSVHGRGYSVWATPISRFGLEGLVRYDSLRPDADHSDGRKERLILGVAYWFPAFKGAQAAVLGDFEKVAYDASLPPAYLKAAERRYAIHTLLSF